MYGILKVQNLIICPGGIIVATTLLHCLHKQTSHALQ